MHSRALACLPAVAFAFAAATALAQAPAIKEPIRIGVLTDMSGVYASVAGKGSVEATRMAAEDFMKANPAYTIEVVQADHQNKPDIAIATAHKWMSNENVNAVVELTSSAIALAVQKMAGDVDNTVVLTSGAATSELTGKACSPVGFHWTYDTYAQARGTGRAIVQQGGKSWFFVSVDYVFGRALQQDVIDAVEALGGKVIGEVKHPLGTADFSSYLLQAQASGADVIGLANSGDDVNNAIKQAHEFRIDEKQRLAALLIYINNVHALGLQTAQNVYLTTGFYWDRTDATREWSKRFMGRVGSMPSMAQAGDYSAVMHYLNAVAKAGTVGAKKVSRVMKETPVNDFFAENGVVREDGRMVHDMYLARVKQPSESKYPWDYYEIVATIPGNEAFRPMQEGGCPLVAAR